MKARIKELYLNDIFKFTSSENWKQVRKINNGRLYFSPRIRKTDRRFTKANGFKDVSHKSNQIVHLYDEDIF